MSELIRMRDLHFLLFEWLEIEGLLSRERFASHDKDAFVAILDIAQRMAQDHFATHAAKLDQNEPHVVDGKVQLIPEVKAALEVYIEAGLLAGSFDQGLGGLQLPYTITQAYHALLNAANVSSMAYPFLTYAAANLLAAFGDDAQRERFVRPMLEGRYFGTMCLSEPQAGSSLSDITTRAEPTERDGIYQIRGSKMWISGGEHELSENIIHLVLAKIPGGPAGVKGISLFIVPRYWIEDDGNRGPANDVTLAGLNHKMGYRGAVNTVLNFGEEGRCRGILLGEPHKGLRYMFHMMNEARIGVGLGATSMGYAGYLYSLEYAKTRKQGRNPKSKDPTSAPIPIIEHSDVKRMLLAQKAYSEGALALGLYCAKLIDEQMTHPEADQRKEAGLLLDFLTPIAKAWPSQYCLKANDLAIQVLGGYGYTREYPVERLYRDNRLNPIHEGTNGIQAIDLLGRKVTMHDGAGLQLLSQKLLHTAEACASQAGLEEYAASLRDAHGLAVETTQALLGAALSQKIDIFLANASVYLDMMGHIAIAWMWLQQASVAHAKLASANPQEAAFYRGKLQACQYFYRWELPQIQPQAALLQSLDDTCLRMQIESF